MHIFRGPSGPACGFGSGRTPPHDGPSCSGRQHVTPVRAPPRTQTHATQAAKPSSATTSKAAPAKKPAASAKAKKAGPAKGTHRAKLVAPKKRQQAGATSEQPGAAGAAGAAAAAGQRSQGGEDEELLPELQQAAAAALSSQRGEQGDDDEELFPELQLELPTATHTKVKTTAYLKSCVKHEDCPPPKYPEFAVIGRSNVGKSSLINMITNSKRLAHVSKEPGKTRCINHFLINDSWYLVDLPGYGYARVGEAQRLQFDQFTKDYFAQRSNLAMVFLLIDSTIKPQKVDVEYATWLTDNQVPFCIVFTKMDKRRKGGSDKDSNISNFKRELLKDFEYLPPSIATSAEDGTGKTPMLHLIASLRVAYEQAGGRR